MFRFRSQKQPNLSNLFSSRLFDQDTFYQAFLEDMHKCRSELIIESPFITTKRVATLFPTIEKLRKRNVRVIINTRDPNEHDAIYQSQAEEAIAKLQAIDVTVLYTTNHHRKVIVLDRTILWEGSLNVLSQNDTCEIMRRINSSTLAQQMVDFLHVEQYLVQ